MATIVLDATIDDAIGHVWLEVDGNDIEAKEEAAVKHGYSPRTGSSAHLVIRWMTPEEAKVAPPQASLFRSPASAPEPGPPKEGRA